MKLQLKNNMLINPYIFGDNFAIDISGLNITRAWALAKVSGGTLDTCIKIRNGDGVSATGSYYYVFFDENNEISVNSLTSVTTNANSNPQLATPGTDTLADIITAGSNTNWFVYDWFCQLTGKRLNKSAGGLGTLLVRSNALITKNGKPALEFQGVNSLNDDGQESLGGGSITELNNGNDYTYTVVSAQITTPAIAALISNTDGVSNNSNSVLFHDTDTSVRGLLWVNTAGSVFDGDLDSQQNNTDQRVQSGVVSSDVQTYYNGTAQTANDTISGTCDNNLLQIGARRTNINIYSGYIQSAFVHDTNIDATTAQNTYDNLDDYFTF